MKLTADSDCPCHCRCLRDGVQGQGHGQRGPDGGAEEGEGALERGGRAHVHPPRDLPPQADGEIRTPQHRQVPTAIFPHTSSI